MGFKENFLNLKKLMYGLPKMMEYDKAQDGANNLVYNTSQRCDVVLDKLYMKFYFKC